MIFHLSSKSGTLEVYKLPTCDNCINHAFGPLGLYCVEFHEEIADESAANDCNLYQEY